MKTKPIQQKEKSTDEVTGAKTISLQRAKEIMNEEAIEYTDEELKEILDFISKVITITTSHYERVKEKQAKIISINTNSTHETKSIPLHQSKYGRTG
jgi:hypothetical protein